MPVDYEHYYGFTRFAIELNELDPEMSKYLPLTDTRFRPDQRFIIIIIIIYINFVPSIIICFI